MVRTGDREIPSVSRGVAISGFKLIFILKDTTRRVNQKPVAVFPTSCHIDYEFLVQKRRFQNSTDRKSLKKKEEKRKKTGAIPCL